MHLKSFYILQETLVWGLCLSPPVWSHVLSGTCWMHTGSLLADFLLGSWLSIILEFNIQCAAYDKQTEEHMSVVLCCLVKDFKSFQAKITR